VDGCPQIRYLEAIPVEAEGQRVVALRDPEGLSEQMPAVPLNVYFLLTLMDGEHSVLDLQEAYARKFDGQLITSEQIGELVRQLDGLYLLDSERFHAFRAEVDTAFRGSRVRPAAHAGASYPDDPDALREMIDGFFEPPDGPGPPREAGSGRPLRGLIAPHIDFGRGGHAFAWAYRSLAEAPKPDLFVLLGTGHAAHRPFSVADKDYETPFGAVRADREVIDRLASTATDELFDDVLCHRTEHSIEFQAVFLKYLYPDSEVMAVPVLCGSFHELVAGGDPSGARLTVDAFLEGLVAALDGSGREVCYIAGVDFSHVGARCGDSEPLTEGVLGDVEKLDRELLRASEAVDSAAFLSAVVRERDRTRVCGVSSVYTLLRAIDAERGELLKYDRTVDEASQSLVSFASMAFH